MFRFVLFRNDHLIIHLLARVSCECVFMVAFVSRIVVFSVHILVILLLAAAGGGDGGRVQLMITIRAIVLITLNASYTETESAC